MPTCPDCDEKLQDRFEYPGVRFYSCPDCGSTFNREEVLGQ